MASDNGKPGKLDMYDVWHLLSYLETHYHGSVQLLMERSVGEKQTELLCSITFVPHDGRTGCGAGVLLEVPATASMLLDLPRRLLNAMLQMQEEIDSARPGTLIAFISNGEVPS